MDIASYQEVSAGPFALDNAGWPGSGRVRLDPARGSGGVDETGAPALPRAGVVKSRLDPARVINDDMWWQSAHSVGAADAFAAAPPPPPHETLAEALPLDLAPPPPAGLDPEPEREPLPEASAVPAGRLRRLLRFAADTAVVRGIHGLRLRWQRPAAPAAPAAPDRAPEPLAEPPHPAEPPLPETIAAEAAAETRAAAADPSGAGEGMPVFLFAGEISYAAGADILTDALIACCQGHPGVRFVVVGDGPLKEAMEAQIWRAGLAHRCRFTGDAAAAEFEHFLEACDVVVIPARERQQGGVAERALSLGKPVLTTHAAQVDGIVHGQNGLLAYDCANSLVWGVRELLAKPLTPRPRQEAVERKAA